MFVPGVDWTSIVRAIMFALFAVLTAIVSAIIGPTYDNLLVPLLRPSSLFPPLAPGAGGPSDYLSGAAAFSAYTLANVVDPAVALVAVGVAFLLLVRAAVTRWAEPLTGLLPRLVAAVVVANFTLPIAGAILDVAGSLYPVLAGWDGGAWDQWQNLAGWGQISFSWDNGALAFVLSFVEFLTVFGLLLAVGVRDALLGVLLVLLPIFTLLWPLRPVSALARRAWLLFVELAFLPCVLIVPLQLAVGTPSPILLVGYLGVALACPFLLSMAGTQLVAFGLPSSGGAVSGGTQRGFVAGSASASSMAGPSTQAVAKGSAGGRALSGMARAGGTSAFPASAPLAVAELVGHGAHHLLQHVRGSPGDGVGPWPPMRDRGGR